MPQPEIMPLPEAEQHPLTGVTDDELAALLHVFEETGGDLTGERSAHLFEGVETANPETDPSKPLDTHFAGEEPATRPAEKITGIADIIEPATGIQELKERLARHLDAAAEEQVALLLDNSNVLHGAELISRAIEQTLETTGINQSASAHIVEALQNKPELRHQAKASLIEAAERLMEDPKLGKDQEKVGRLEKALDALEKAS